MRLYNSKLQFLPRLLVSAAKYVGLLKVRNLSQAPEHYLVNIVNPNAYALIYAYIDSGVKMIVEVEIMSKRIGRYGMAFSTIRYIQREAWDLWRYNGLRIGGRLLSGDLSASDNRAIARAVIGLRQSTPQATIQKILDGLMIVSSDGCVVPAKLR